MAKINEFAAKLAADAGLTATQTDALGVLVKRIAAAADTLEVRRLSRAFLDPAALDELGIGDDPTVAALARQTLTAREMEIAGEPFGAVTNADPHASARAMIAQLTEAGDAGTAERLQAGLDEVLSQEKEEETP